jgi:hypothetical protein
VESCQESITHPEGQQHEEQVGSLLDCDISNKELCDDGVFLK